MTLFKDMPTVMLVDALRGIWRRGSSIMPNEDIELAWDEPVSRLTKSAEYAVRSLGMRAHTRFKYLDHCGSCGAIVMFFQTPGRQITAGCDCLAECEHQHAASVYDLSYSIAGTPVRSAEPARMTHGTCPECETCHDCCDSVTGDCRGAEPQSGASRQNIHVHTSSCYPPACDRAQRSAYMRSAE